MNVLVIKNGPMSEVGKELLLDKEIMVLGRDTDADIVLASQAVSRRHAKLVQCDGAHVFEDLGSRNGIHVNGQRVNGSVALASGDELRVADYFFHYVEREPVAEGEDAQNTVIRDKIDVRAGHEELFALNPAHQLQIVLKLSQHLSRTLDQPTLLRKLLEHLFALFPRADQGLVAICREDRLEVRAQRTRHAEEDFHYSRSVLRQALAEGVGILSDDVSQDDRFALVATLGGEARSILCVPLIGNDARTLGAIYLACNQSGKTFSKDDLYLLTTIGLQVAVVLENVALNEKKLRDAHLLQELATARDIQQSALPTHFAELASAPFEVFGRVWPAHEASGDLYDFLPLDENRLAFFVGDVSGKGMPAALFMFAVRSLARHIAATSQSPCASLVQLNDALARDNPSCLFVTMLHGVLDQSSGQIALTCAGHPPPLLRKADGQVRELTAAAGRFLGFEGAPDLHELRIDLQPGETLIAFTDGFTETFADHKTMFGAERLRLALAETYTLALDAWANQLKDRVLRFGNCAEPQDDLTLLMIRRR